MAKRVGERRPADGFSVLLLAAGKATRFKSEHSKVLHRLAGGPGPAGGRVRSKRADTSEPLSKKEFRHPPKRKFTKSAPESSVFPALSCSSAWTSFRTGTRSKSTCSPT